jgi:hypothetical protein
MIIEDSRVTVKERMAQVKGIIKDFLFQVASEALWLIDKDFVSFRNPRDNVIYRFINRVPPIFTMLSHQKSEKAIPNIPHIFKVDELFLHLPESEEGKISGYILKNVTVVFAHGKIRNAKTRKRWKFSDGQPIVELVNAWNSSPKEIIRSGENELPGYIVVVLACNKWAETGDQVFDEIRVGENFIKSGDPDSLIRKGLGVFYAVNTVLTVHRTSIKDGKVIMYVEMQEEMFGGLGVAADR